MQINYLIRFDGNTPRWTANGLAYLLCTLMSLHYFRKNVRWAGGRMDGVLIWFCSYLPCIPMHSHAAWSNNIKLFARPERIEGPNFHWHMADDRNFVRHVYCDESWRLKFSSVNLKVLCKLVCYQTPSKRMDQSLWNLSSSNSSPARLVMVVNIGVPSPPSSISTMSSPLLDILQGMP